MTPPAEGRSAEPIVVVSGLPRSGTSLMMQILDAGGIAPLTDGNRTADDSNPRGYFELDASKRLGRDHSIIEPAAVNGLAIKVISALVNDLPRAHEYRVLYMRRDITEVARSQQQMLVALGESSNEKPPTDIAARLKAHDARARARLENMRHCEVLDVEHRRLVRRPRPELDRIVDFIGPHRLPTAHRMTDVIDRDLYRSRSGFWSKSTDVFTQVRHKASR